MRKLYLIRHARPVPYKDGHVCLSRTDLPLSDIGREQAETLKRWFQDKAITAAYASTLLRAAETANVIADGKIPVIQSEALCEVSVGLWEGLSFSEIKERYPAEYAARGEHIATYPPPGGESFIDAAERMEGAIWQILQKTEGDIAIVAHAGIIRAWYCKVSGTDMNNLFSIPQPYGGITEVRLDDDVLTPIYAGEKLSMLPGKLEQAYFYRLFHTPDEVQAHCRAVADKAIEIAQNCDADVNYDLLRCSALLHDIARTEGKRHPIIGAEAIRKEGYSHLANIIAQHHDLTQNAPSEAEILYLADTTTAGVSPVTIEERFSASREKCKTPEAVAAWEARYSAARRVQQKYLKG